MVAFVVIIFSVFLLYFGYPWIYGRLLRLLLRIRVVKQRALVLTFDDGPSSRLTPAILDIVAEHNVKATFFLFGRSVAGREYLVRQIAEQGHEICSHGYDHVHHWKVSPNRAIKDIRRGWRAIDTALGVEQQKYPFRPPYGKLNLFCLLYLWIHRIPICYWTLVSSDTWPTDQQDRQRISSLASRTGGAATLAHDFDREDDDVGDMVLDSLRSTLSMARETGMKTLTMSEFVGNIGKT